MAVLEVIVVMRSIDIAGNDGGELATMLLGIPTIHHIYHPLGIAVPVGILHKRMS